MTGIITLFAAVMAVPVKRDENPFGIEKAWQWLSRVLNLPRNFATPTILVAFLEVAGRTNNPRPLA